MPSRHVVESVAVLAATAQTGVGGQGHLSGTFVAMAADAAENLVFIMGGFRRSLQTDLEEVLKGVFLT